MALPRDLGPLFKFSPESSAHAWAILEENWSPAELQLCRCLAMDPVDPDPDLQTDFQPGLRAALSLWACLATTEPYPNPDLRICFPGWPRASLITVIYCSLAVSRSGDVTVAQPARPLAQTPGDPPQHHIPQGTTGPWCSLRHNLCSLAVVPSVLQREGPWRKREPA